MILVKINREDNRRFFEQLIEVVGNRLIELMRKELEQKDAIATGYLYSSFRLEVEGEVGFVRNEAPYSKVLEYGCVPHTPSYEAILRWVEIKKEEVGPEAERAAWKIVKKIEREGYEGRFYARDALERMVRFGGRL